MVINCTPQSLLLAGSGSAVSLSSAAPRPGPSRFSSPPGSRSRQLQSRLRLARAVSSTQAAPPTSSQTASSQLPSDAVGWAARKSEAAASASSTRAAAGRPVSLSSVRRLPPRGPAGGANQRDIGMLKNQLRVLNGRLAGHGEHVGHAQFPLNLAIEHLRMEE